MTLPLGSVRRGELADAVVGEERPVAERIGDRGQAPVGVVAVAPGPELAVLVGGEVEVVVGVEVRRAVGVGDLGDAVGGVVAVGDAPALGIGEGRDPVEGVVGEARGGDAVGVDDRDEIACASCTGSSSSGRAGW